MADTKIIDAIMRLNSSAEVVVTGTDINTCTIDWLNGTTPISKADIQAEMERLQAEYDAKEWERSRVKEYPSIEECVHAILDDDLENLQILRQAVKEKFPKNE